MSEPIADAGVIGRHYDERTPIADVLRDGQLHMWYFYDDADDASLPAAVHRMTRKVTETLGVRPGEHVLDAGCGPGNTAVYLAAELGARVTGVTLSEVEVAAARRRAEERGLSERVRIDYGDYAELPFPDGAFDAVLALESLQNAADVGAVLAELFRVLRPGGRLTLSDFSLESAEDPERLATFMATLKLPTLPTLPGWLEHVRRAGFAVEEYTQCGPRSFGMKARYLRAAMAQRDQVAAQFGETAVAEFSSRHRGFFAPRKHQVGYVIVAARKPS